MHKTLHPRDDIDWLYLSRKEERRGLVSIEDYDDTFIRRVEDYIKKSKERQITAAQQQHCQYKDKIKQLRKLGNGKKNNCMDITSDNRWKLTRENMDRAKKGKSLERNWIFSNSSIKQRHKDQLYKSVNR